MRAEAAAEGFAVLAEAGSLFRDEPGLTAATTAKWAARHRSELVDYTAAILAAARWCASNRNRDELTAMMAEDREAGPEAVSDLLDLELGAVTQAAPTIDRAAVSLATVERRRRERTGVGTNGYFASEYMDEAFASLVV